MKTFITTIVLISLIALSGCGQITDAEEGAAQGEKLPEATAQEIADESETDESENEKDEESEDESGDEKDEESEEEYDIPLSVREEVIDVPMLKKEHSIFFFADTHVSLCDDRDADLMEKAAFRGSCFAIGGIPAQERFDRIVEEANSKEREIVLLGGDIIDSAMYASIEHVSKGIDTLNAPHLFLTGNHDFEYGEEYFSPKAYQNYLPRLEDLRGENSYQIRECDDIIYFAADDSNNQIDGTVLEAFTETAQKGKPIVLSLHVPIEPVTGNMALVERCKKVWGETADGKSKVTLGVNGCKPNDTTAQFIKQVTAEDSPVVLVLAGHIHFYHKDYLNDKIIQIVTGAGYEGDAVEVTLK